MTIGVLCGLQAEARIADRFPHVLVGCTGARLERAQTLAKFLLQKGVRRLISFGLAAGLTPDIEAGDLLLGATVVSPYGAWEADEAWNAQFVECIPCYQCAPIWGSDTLLKTGREKIAVGIRSGCLAADMESHVVAEAAAYAKIPFNVLRAVSDPSPVDLPPAALVPLTEDGKVDFGGVFRSIYDRPAQVPELIKIGINTKRALSALRSAVDVIADIEGEGL
jgi:hopanoid-associated phosphorylase